MVAAVAHVEYVSARVRNFHLFSELPYAGGRCSTYCTEQLYVSYLIKKVPTTARF